jgi:hypothetical protein
VSSPSIEPKHEKLRAAAAFPKSFFKRDWVLDDYPVRLRHQVADEHHLDLGPDYKLVPWDAQIINWWQMNGGGETRQEAYADLKRNFLEFKATGNSLPRPGTGLPLESAPTTIVGDLDEVMAGFEEKILEAYGIGEVVITDNSSLHDFAPYPSVHDSINRIREVYGIDVSDVPGLYMAEIPAMIAAMPDLNPDEDDVA